MVHDRHHDPPTVPLSGTVLYIEDQPTNVALIEAMLSRHPGIAFRHAGTGTEGVRMALAERPDFVLLDMHLPDMSGLDVVRQLSTEINERGLRVTILTGDSLTMDIIKAMSLGAYEYWIKPLRLALFEDGLARALTGRQPDPARRLNTR